MMEMHITFVLDAAIDTDDKTIIPVTASRPVRCLCDVVADSTSTNAWRSASAAALLLRRNAGPNSA
jgi:hypothetical protein